MVYAESEGENCVESSEWKSEYVNEKDNHKEKAETKAKFLHFLCVAPFSHTQHWVMNDEDVG